MAGENVLSDSVLKAINQPSNVTSLGSDPLIVIGSEDTGGSPEIPLNTSSVMVGTSTSSSLQSVVFRRPEKLIHISRLSTSTTVDQIYDFFSSTFSLSKDDIHVHKIIPKDRGFSTVSFSSFKVGCSEVHYKKILYKEKWPVGVVVKEFVPKNLVSLHPKPLP